MTVFLPDGNGEGQDMLAIHNVNSVQRFMGYVLKEGEIRAMRSKFKCNMT